MGAVLREQNALPTIAKLTIKPTAKAAINNCRAGRAAKGENPSACAKNETSFAACFYFLGANESRKKARIIGGSREGRKPIALNPRNRC